MFKTLKKLGNRLSKIFTVIIIVLTFVSFTNNNISDDAITKLHEQIAFNKEHTRSALSVDGVNDDGTKMTEEQIKQQKEWESQIIDVDVLTPKILELTKKVDIQPYISLGLAIVFGGILIVLGFGVFKSIARMSSALVVGILINIGFVFNFLRYVKMGKIENICAPQIAILIVLFLTYLISKAISLKLTSRKEIKEFRSMEDKIRDRLQATKNIEQEILNASNDKNDPIFVVATKEASTTTVVEERNIGIERENKELNKIAYYDNLTNVFNRAAFNKDMSKYEEDKMDCVIAMFDVNNLKTTNDTLGHKYGDTLIKIVANTLSDTFKGVGKCYRIGGDEFVVIAKNRKIENKVAKCIDEVKAILAEKKYIDIFPNLITVACGYAVYDSLKHNTLNDVLDEADELMYQNKKAMKEEMNKKPLKVEIEEDEMESTFTTDEQEINETEKLNDENSLKGTFEIEVEDNEEQEQFEPTTETIEEVKSNIEEDNNMVEEIVKEVKPEENIEKMVEDKIEENEIKTVEPIKLKEEKTIKEDLSKIEISGQTQEYVYETYIEKIDGTREKIEHPDTTITADYESIRNYLDRKEAKQNEVIIEQKAPVISEDLPYANYDPEKESPFSRSNIEIIETDAEIIEREEINNVDIQNSSSEEDDM